MTRTLHLQDVSEMAENIHSSQPIVSVIIPCYNGEKFIGNAIKSVLNQTYENWQLIIVDDGSSDSSCEIVEHYLINSKIGVVKNSHNLGIARTLNRGIEASRGEFVAFLDQDDIWRPEKLQLQLQKFVNAESDLGLVGCGMVFVENNRCRGIFKINDEKLDQTSLLTRIFLTNGNSSSIMVVRKDCLEKVGLFDENLVVWCDFEMVFRIAKFYEVGHVNSLLVKKRLHSESANVKLRKEIRNEAIRVFSVICDYHPFLGSYLSLKQGRMILDEAVESLCGRRYEHARQLSLKAIQSDPRLRMLSGLVYLLSYFGATGLIIHRLLTVVALVRNQYKHARYGAALRTEGWPK